MPAARYPVHLPCKRTTKVNLNSLQWTRVVKASLWRLISLNKKLLKTLLFAIVKISEHTTQLEAEKLETDHRADHCTPPKCWTFMCQNWNIKSSTADFAFRVTRFQFQWNIYGGNLENEPDSHQEISTAYLIQQSMPPCFSFVADNYYSNFLRHIHMDS